MSLKKPKKIIRKAQGTVREMDILRNKTIDECFNWFEQEVGELETDVLQIYVPVRCVKELLMKLMN